MSANLIIVVRYPDMPTDNEDQPIVRKVTELIERLSDLPAADVFVAIGESYDRISTVVEAESSR